MIAFANVVVYNYQYMLDPKVGSVVSWLPPPAVVVLPVAFPDVAHDSSASRMGVVSDRDKLQELHSSWSCSSEGLERLLGWLRWLQGLVWEGLAGNRAAEPDRSDCQLWLHVECSMQLETDSCHA